MPPVGAMSRLVKGTARSSSCSNWFALAGLEPVVALDDGVHRQEFHDDRQTEEASNTARALLTMAATRDDHLIALPKLPTAAVRQVVRSLLNAAMVQEIPAPIMIRPLLGGLAKMAAC